MRRPHSSRPTRRGAGEPSRRASWSPRPWCWWPARSPRRMVVASLVSARHLPPPTCNAAGSRPHGRRDHPSSEQAFAFGDSLVSIALGVALVTSVLMALARDRAYFSRRVQRSIDCRRRSRQPQHRVGPVRRRGSPSPGLGCGVRPAGRSPSTSSPSGSGTTETTRRRMPGRPGPRDAHPARQPSTPTSRPSRTACATARRGHAGRAAQRHPAAASAWPRTSAAVSQRRGGTAHGITRPFQRLPGRCWSRQPLRHETAFDAKGVAAARRRGHRSPAVSASTPTGWARSSATSSTTRCATRHPGGTVTLTVAST